jgi:hypothetical protein
VRKTIITKFDKERIYIQAYPSVTKFVPRCSKEIENRRFTREGTEMGRELTEGERSGKRKERFAYIGLPLSQLFLE